MIFSLILCAPPIASYGGKYCYTLNPFSKMKTFQFCICLLIHKNLAHLIELLQKRQGDQMWNKVRVDLEEWQSSASVWAALRNGGHTD